ncbi:hypothetical protein VF21_02635, partial [Pseudogymnoascus sp. 05NY08]
MSLTEDQLFAVSIAERVSSAVSLCCASTAVLTFLLRKAFRTPINRLIVYALYGNILLNIATLISLSGPQHGARSPLCQFQAFLIQWLFPADALWAVCIAWNVYLRFFYRYNSAQLRQLEWRYVLFCYALPLIPAFVLLFIRTPSRGKVYGPATFECWIAIRWDALRIAILYGPVWLVIMITIALYIRIGLYIYSRLKQLREVQTSTGFAEDINRIAQTSNPETYEMTQASSTPDQYPRQAAESGISVQRTATENSIRTHSRDLVRSGSDSNMAAWA